MNPPFSHPLFGPQQLILLFGGVLLVIIALVLGVYFLQKSLRHTADSDAPKAPKLRVDDEAAFTLATVKGVMTQLKSEQKAAQEKLIATERRAEEYARKFELLAREIDFGLMIFDADGYITFSNPLARKIVAVDTWSRRRHGEIFRDIPALATLIAECAAAGTDVRNRPLEFQAADGSRRSVEVSVLTTRDRCGAMEAIACLCRAREPV